MKRLLIIFLNISFALSALSQYGGNHTYAFLDLPNSAHSTALGGYNLSIKDVNSVFNNPALLDSTMLNYLTISYVNYFAGINWGYSAYSFSGKKYGNFAVAMQYINYGKFIAANEDGIITGEFNASDYTISALWSYQLDSFFTAGAILKPIYSNYETYSSFGLALDLGVNYLSSNKLFSAGLVVRNFGTQIKPYVPKQYEKLPFDISIGLSQKFAHAPFRMSVVVHHLNKPDLSYEIPIDDNVVLNQETTSNKLANIADLTLRHFIFGMELVPSNNFYLSFGLNYQRRQELKLENYSGLSGFSAGLGLKIKKFNFNYGISRFNKSGSMHNFTFSLNLRHLNKLF